MDVAMGCGSAGAVAGAAAAAEAIARLENRALSQARAEREHAQSLAFGKLIYTHPHHRYQQGVSMV